MPWNFRNGESVLLLIFVVGAGRPNILIAIADDQSYPHTSAYGDPVIKTPAFDRVARERCFVS